MRGVLTLTEGKHINILNLQDQPIKDGRMAERKKLKELT